MERAYRSMEHGWERPLRKEKPAGVVGGNEQRADGEDFSGGIPFFWGDFAGSADGGIGVAYGVRMSDFPPFWNHAMTCGGICVGGLATG